MAIEIERKFLVRDDSWRPDAGEGNVCRQGYLLSNETATVRVRMIGSQAFLTVKGPTQGISRSEFEYEIPLEDAAELLSMCECRVEKTRYYIQHKGMLWEVDVFSGANQGLVMAEVEMESSDQPVELPDWTGEEVSGDARYYNGYLARHPFMNWH